MSKVLVINKNYQAINIIGYKKAIILLWKEVATVVQIEHTVWNEYNWESWLNAPVDGLPVVKTPKFDLAIPEIIRLCNHNGFRQADMKYNRRAIYNRDGVCQYCGVKPDVYTIDHIIPISQSGRSTWENCVACCAKCNAKKADKTLKEAGMRLLKQPVKPSFKLIHKAHCQSWEHFL